MQLDRCKSCGGDLERIGNYYVCHFCGNKWMIDADNDVHVIDRANAWSALRDCDFERAVELFENIIFKEPKNHEAYWGRALASAGIMYVTDLDEHKKVPTCNSISEFSFIESKDVQKAISLAPKDISDTYKKQAEQIESIRVEWLKKASKEKPYDVFICFKDSDREHNIDRTDDSYDAHELYNALTAEGYKVFFSRVSLRDKISEHYEPYIYNALKTAKVMIVFGEKPEYFNAVWVKNEWTRFRSMIERGEKDKSSLVVVYKNMTPNDLPAGLRSRQCLDAGEMTFLDTLKHHIEKIVNPPKPKAETAPEIQNTPPAPPKKSKKGLIIAAVALVLAISIALGVILPGLSNGNGDNTGDRVDSTETDITSQEDITTEATESSESTETESLTEDISTESNSQNEAASAVGDSATETDTEEETTEKVTEADTTETVTEADTTETDTEESETVTDEQTTETDTDEETTEGPTPTVENKEHGVKLFFDDTALPQGTVLSVAAIESGEEHSMIAASLEGLVEKFYAYDMNLSIFGSKLDPQGSVTVSLPLPSDIPSNQAAVYYISADGIYTELASTVSNGRISFKTDHFSIYVVAQKIIPRSTLIFNANGGSGSMDNIEVYSSQTTRLPASTFTKVGYHIAGWSASPTGEIIALNKGNYQVGANPVYNLYAVWAPNTNNIELDANGGSCDIDELTATYDQEYTLPEPERVGYSFDGWFYNGKEYTSGATWKTTNDITLTAEWTANNNTKYVVRHHLQNVNDDGYTVDTTQNLTGTSDKTITPTVKTYSGFTSPTAKTVAIKPDGSLVVDYYYTRNSYTLTFITNGGATVASITKKYQAALSLPTAERLNYTFGGWFSNEKLTTAYAATSMPASNKTLYAYWSEEIKPSELTYSGSSTVSVSGYSGTASKLWLPTYIGGKQVTSIATSAFSNKTSLTSVVIPAFVTSIGNGAFGGCSSLATVYCSCSLSKFGKVSIGSNNSYLTNAEKVYNYYTKCDECTPAEAVVENYIESTSCSVGSTYDSVVYCKECDYEISRVKKTAEPKHILEYSISGDTVTITGPCNCGSADIVIPDSYQNKPVTHIYDSAFNECSSLTSITIPNSVTSIGHSAFFYCSSLKSVNLPDSVTSIGEGAFGGCSSLTSITIPDSVTSIGGGAFYNCSSLTSITIPDSVTSIGESAFEGCSSLESITIPDSVTSISDYAFRNCSSLTSITIPDSVTSIGSSAFSGCSSLTSITIPDSVTSIGFSAFEDCSSLEAVHISDVAAWCNISFGYLSANPLYYANNLYLNEELITDLVIPDSVTSIGSYAFYGCSSLTSVKLPDSVTSIGSSAFYNCSSLTSIVFSENSQLTSIGSYAFRGCSSLESIVFSENSKLTSIGSSAFYDCTSLKSITIPNSVTSIGNYAFYGCSSLENITVPAFAISHMPKDKLKTVVITSGTSIGSSAFRGCSSLTSITIPDSVTSIGNYAFYGCSSLMYNEYDNAYYLGNEINPCVVLVKAKNTDIASCEINSNTKFIHSSAFSGCSSLTSITIPDSVTSIDSEAFYGCWSLTSVVFGKSGQLSSIGYSAFSGCSSLTSITIPDGVTSIDSEAFYGCSSLESIVIPDSVTEILFHAFEDCSSLTSAMFENPNGWWCSISSFVEDAGEGIISISNSDLANASTAATCLKSTYSGYYWRRD